jgi:YHS domain-containing protein
MADANSLAGRIDAQFTAVQEKVKKSHTDQAEERKQRQKRLEQLNEVFDEMRDIWKPRLDVLVKRFGDRVEAKPRIVPSTREVTFQFESRQARVSLRLSASTDRDISKVVLGYDLEIIPVLMRYDPHAEVEFPLDAVDKEAAAKWIDDCIVEFVRTYLSMGENEIYLKEYMVEDPVSHVRFPSMAAGASLEWQGEKVYFVSEETRREFEKEKGIGAK